VVATVACCTTVWNGWQKLTIFRNLYSFLAGRILWLPKSRNYSKLTKSNETKPNLLVSERCSPRICRGRKFAGNALQLEGGADFAWYIGVAMLATSAQRGNGWRRRCYDVGKNRRPRARSSTVRAIASTRRW